MRPCRTYPATPQTPQPLREDALLTGPIKPRQLAFEAGIGFTLARCGSSDTVPRNPLAQPWTGLGSFKRHRRMEDHVQHASWNACSHPWSPPTHVWSADSRWAVPAADAPSTGTGYQPIPRRSATTGHHHRPISYQVRKHPLQPTPGHLWPDALLDLPDPRARVASKVLADELTQTMRLDSREPTGPRSAPAHRA